MVNFGVVTNNQYGNFCSLAFIGFKDGQKMCWIISSVVSCILCSRCGWHQVGSGVSGPGVALITRVVDGVLGSVEDGPDHRAGNNLSWLSRLLGDLKTHNS